MGQISLLAAPKWNDIHMNLHTSSGLVLLVALWDKGTMITHEIAFNLHVLLISGLYYVSKYEGILSHNWYQIMALSLPDEGAG